MTVQLISKQMIAETSSKGNQNKWFDEKSNLWYKLDEFGYEALSETVISEMLKNFEPVFPFVQYHMQKINVHNKILTGCCSENFLRNGENIVTLSKLFKKYIDIPIGQKLSGLSSNKKRLEYIYNITKELTGLEHFGEYLTFMFEIDALFLNDDRHLNNIAVIEKDGKFDYCPLFDNGAGLLSNMMFYRSDIEPAAHIRSAVSAPLHISFTRQVNIMRSLFGSQLNGKKISKNEIRDILYDKLKFYPFRDQGLITDRVIACILTQQRKLFK